MSAEEDTELRDLVAHTLEMNGVLNKIRAELRANVFLALEEQDTLQKKSITNKALKNFLDTKEGHQTFSLVREFLQFFNLDFTLAVLDPESDYVSKSSSRENLINDMNLYSVPSSTPLLTEVLKRKGEERSAPSSPRHGTKIPQRITQSKTIKDTSDKSLSKSSHSDIDNEDDLLKELGVSPISYNSTKKNTKPSWLEPSNKSLEKLTSKKADDNALSPLTGLGSLKGAPPLPGIGGKNTQSQSPLDVTSPEWDDLMKIDQKISDLGFEIPKEDHSTSLKEKKSSLKDDYNYDDDDFNPSSSQKSDNLSITEEIEDEISIGSFAGSKADDILTTDQTVSHVSADGFDYGEDADIF